MGGRPAGRESAHPGFTAELAEQDDPAIGQELIRVRFDDGRVQELHLHDYEQVYSLPGIYEQIVQARLGCRSPVELASMLAQAADDRGWRRADVRVLDLAAGNGVSGEALAAAGLRPVLGTDIVPSARTAALRDRPGLYDQYLTLDLLHLSSDQQAAIRGLRATALSCVAPVGDDASQLPSHALLAGAALLEPDALVAYMHDPTFGVDDPVTAKLWAARLGSGTVAQELTRRRYLHRYTVNGEPFEMDAIVWWIRRA